MNVHVYLRKSTCVLDANFLPTTHVTATQSSTYYKCGAMHAVDDRILQGPAVNDAQLCHSCSVTNGKYPSWLQLDLGKKYLVDGVRVYGRDNGK